VALVQGCLVLLIANVAVFARTFVFDTDTFADTLAPEQPDEEVIAGVADTLSDQIVTATAGEHRVGGRSGREGKGTDAAGDGYPAPDAPPISLIGTIGSTGRFFLIGAATTHFVDDAEGPLFLAVNDANPGDNWGFGLHVRRHPTSTLEARGGWSGGWSAHGGTDAPRRRGCPRP
jgi:hypothetical protein